MTIQQCLYVLEVAKKGSINEAANSLFVAQTSISSGIRQLESELNIKIFERSNKGVILTGEGAEFLQYAKQIVYQSNFIYERYNCDKESEKICVSSQHYDFIAQIFGRFLNENDSEKFFFALHETRTYEVIFNVEKSISDIGIIGIKSSDSKPMERFLNKRGLVFNPLFSTLPHVFIRSGHPLSKKQAVREADLSKYPYIYYEQGEHKSSFFLEEVSEIASGGKIVEITDRATLMNFLLLTDCYTVGTGIMTSKLNDGNIIAVPLLSDDTYTIGYILRENVKVCDYTQKFIDKLVEFSDTVK